MTEPEKVTRPMTTAGPRAEVRFVPEPSKPEKVLREAAAELVGAIERGDDHQTVLRAASAVNQALAAPAPDPGAAPEDYEVKALRAALDECREHHAATLAGTPEGAHGPELTTRQERVRRWAADREKCRSCGLLRINVRHEPDPETAPEGKAYYEAMADLLHEFVPSGEYES